MNARELFYYSIVSVIFLAILIANALVWHSIVVGIFLFLFFLIYYGRQILPQLSMPLRAATLLAFTSLYGTIWFYAASLTQTVTLVGVGLLVLIIPFLPKNPVPSLKLPTQRLKDLTTQRLSLFLIGGIIFLAALSLLTQTEIITPVRSLWLVVPPVFFLCLFLFALLITASRTRLFFIAFFFLTVSVALIVYPLGYGFDSFIHQATEQHIVDYGTITPKPFYYVGQYALVIFATNAFQIPVAIADALLLPLLAVLILAPVALEVLKKDAKTQRLNDSTTQRLTPFAIFLLPLSTFIVTTPQGLANFWALLVILCSIPSRPIYHLPFTIYLPILFTLAALVTHPLSGIPLVLFLILRWLSNDALTLRSSSWRFKGLLGFSGISIPLVFLINSLLSGQTISIHPGQLFNAPFAELFHLSLFFENHFDAWKDAAYLVGWNLTLIVLVLAVCGFVLARRHHLDALRLYGTMSLVLLVNFFLLSRLFEFSFLIEYERSNYAERLFQLAIFFALPLVALSLEEIGRRLMTKPIALRVGAYGLTALVLTATVYLTYPRHDNYEISRGFNVGVSDFATVEYIHSQREPGTYVVLANQAVSAAALKTYGFETYFNGTIFYYPIPTGGELYQLYLEMVNQNPTQERAEKAMDLTGVDTVYFVVNNYWYLSEKIIENAKREATDWVAIDSGTTHVFEYQR